MPKIKYKRRPHDNGTYTCPELEENDRTIKPGPLAIIEFIKKDCLLAGRNRRVATGFFESMIQAVAGGEKQIYWSKEHPLAVYYLGVGNFTYVEPSNRGDFPMKIPADSFFRKYAQYSVFEPAIRAEAAKALGPRLDHEEYMREFRAFLEASKQILGAPKP